MTDIPQDVVERARKAFYQEAKRAAQGNMPDRILEGEWDDLPAVQAIARAIMAEREACAKIAEEATFTIRMNKLWVRNIQDQSQCPPCPIATAIRKGEHHG